MERNAIMNFALGVMFAFVCVVVYVHVTKEAPEPVEVSVEDTRIATLEKFESMVWKKYWCANPRNFNEVNYWEIVAYSVEQNVLRMRVDEFRDMLYWDMSFNTMGLVSDAYAEYCYINRADLPTY